MRYWARLVLSVIIVGMGGVCSALPASSDETRPLSILAPGQNELGRIEWRFELYDFRKEFFLRSPTAEAAQRLAALNRVYDEKLRFHLATQTDVVAYQNANRDLVLWYVRALLRAQLANWFHSAKAYFRGERLQNEMRDRNRALRLATLRQTRQPAGSYAMGSGFLNSSAKSSADSGFEADAYDAPSGFGSSVSAFLEGATRFAESLTNDGINTELGPAVMLVRLDPQSAILSTRISMMIMDVGLVYRLRPGEKPLPFSGNDAVNDSERLMLSGGVTIPVLEITGSMSYAYLHEQLTAAVSREIISPVSGVLARSWNQAGGPPDSLASVSMSVLF